MVPAIVAGALSIVGMIVTGAFPDNPAIQLVASSATLFLLTAAVILVGRERKPGASLTWGEAMVASLVIFFILFWAYGVVPHYFLTMADNQLGWRPDAFLGDSIGFFTPQDQGGFFPLTITLLTIRDLIVVGMYVVFLGAQIALWAWWNDRSKQAPATDVVTSDFGRPLVRKG